MLSAGFWIRTLPSKMPALQKNGDTKVEGPVLLASTHTDFIDIADSATERALNLDKEKENEPSTTENNENNRNTKETSEENIVSSSSKLRSKSISDELLSSSTTISDAILDPNNDIITENYEITDLFPNLSANSSYTFQDNISDFTTEKDHER